MTETLLDSRSRPTTEEERARLYCKPDPTDGEIFLMSTTALDCAACGKAIEICSPVWLREMSEQHDISKLAQHDPELVGQSIYAPHCWPCTSQHFDEEVRDYAEEQRQREREERLEIACENEAAGKLSPVDWFEIMEANLGYCARTELGDAISKMCGEYSRRFGTDNAAFLEQVRAKLWAMVPSDAQQKLVLQTQTPSVEVEYLAGGEAVIHVDIPARVVVR